MIVDLASRSAHHRKYGATFADTWTTRDGTLFVAVGAVVAGGDRIAVSDLLRTGTRAIVGSRAAIHAALRALDKIVQRHAAEQHDTELAAALAILAMPRGEEVAEIVGAGNLHVIVFDAIGGTQPMHGRHAALGTGLPDAPADTVTRAVRVRRDDIVVATTTAIDGAWWPSGNRTAEALLQRSHDAEASAAVILGA